MDKFYQFTKVNEETTELYIFGDIISLAWYENDVSAYDFAKELSEIDTANLNVRINSYGGSVSEGLAIHNLLKSFKGNVTTVCDGFACSIASVIFMAGKKRVMNKGSLLMIHNAWTYAYGNAKDLRKQADDLEKITEPSIQIYLDSSNLSRDEIVSMMDDETWITSDEAIKYGFATEIKDVDPGANQSKNKNYVQCQMMYNQVVAFKDLQKEMSKLNEKLETTEKELNKTKEALEAEKAKQEEKPLSGWDAFFNTKK